MSIDLIVEPAPESEKFGGLLVRLAAPNIMAQALEYRPKHGDDARYLIYQDALDLPVGLPAVRQVGLAPRFEVCIVSTFGTADGELRSDN